MSYTVEWTRSATREVRALPPDAGLRIAEAVGRLSKNPRPAGCKKLVGHKDLWRLRIGTYRVIYFIGDAIRLIRVEHVGHRKGIYR